VVLDDVVGGVDVVVVVGVVVNGYEMWFSFVDEVGVVIFEMWDCLWCGFFVG